MAIRRVVTMPAGLALSLYHRPFEHSNRGLLWGYPALEQENVPQRRGAFSHDFSIMELLDPPITTNPNVELFDGGLPNDWRYEVSLLEDPVPVAPVVVVPDVIEIIEAEPVIEIAELVEVVAPPKKRWSRRLWDKVKKVWKVLNEPI